MNASPSSLRADVKSLAAKSFVYGLGSVLLKSINLLVLPLYTRFLTPADYGVVAIASTLSAFLSIVFPLSLYSAIARFYFVAGSERDKRRMNGTIWLAILGFALVMSLVLDLVGGRLLQFVFPQLPFDPYGRIAIWTAFFGMFGLVPLNLLQVKERPGAYVWWTGTSLIFTVGSVVVSVVFLGQGAYGYLLATLIANAVLALPYVVLTLRDADFTIDRMCLKKALSFSLPLVPHGLASWGLTLSDRAILQLYVTLSALGLYSLGYQIGSIMIMISGAISNAWIPFFFKRVAQEGDAAKGALARIVTYYTLTVCVVAVGLCVFARDAVVLLTHESFHPAHSVVPVIAVGYLWSSLYVIPANFLFAKSQTAWLPVATVAAGMVNIGLNFVLVPHYGIMAAAWATFVAFLVMLVLVFFIARRVFPFPYEYRRLAAILAAAGLVIAVGLSIDLPLPGDLLLKTALFAAFPLLLLACGFFSDRERAAMIALVREAAARIRRLGAMR
jgi:O-antigen/teichoic acid export membrane protein